MASKIPTEELHSCLYKMFYIFTRRNFAKEAYGNRILEFCEEFQSEFRAELPSYR
jgi:hypothetical protein